MSNIETGAVEPIVALVLDQLGQPLVGRTNIKARIWRFSDGEYLDWSDMTFRPAGAVATMLKQLLEVSPSASPGEYRYNLDTGSIANPTADDIYEVTVVQDGVNGAANLPQVGEIRVGQWADKISKRPYTVLQSYSYNPETGLLTGLAWVEHADLVLPTPTSASISWYNADGNLLFTVTDAAPDAQGFFKVSRTITLSSNLSYYAVAQIVVPGVGTVSGGKGIFTVG